MNLFFFFFEQQILFNNQIPAQLEQRSVKQRIQTKAPYIGRTLENKHPKRRKRMNLSLKFHFICFLLLYGFWLQQFNHVALCIFWDFFLHKLERQSNSYSEWISLIQANPSMKLQIIIDTHAKVHLLFICFRPFHNDYIISSLFQNLRS